MDRAALTRRIAAGERLEFMPFYGHTPSGPDVDASCLSQWAVAPFVLDGQVYPTAEHFMMATKARLFGDDDALAQILASPGPREVKALGRQVRGYADGTWAAARFEAVVRGNVAKFGQHEGRRAFLLGTGERVLVEAAPRDTVWGVGLGRSNPAITDPSRWRGQNLLGFALMEVRSVLRTEARP